MKEGAPAQEQGYRMLWGALGQDDRATLVAIVQAHGRAVPRRLALTITEATQSLEIDGRLIPHVLVGDRPAADDLEQQLDPAFVGWILSRSHA